MYVDATDIRLAPPMHLRDKMMHVVKHETTGTVVFHNRKKSTSIDVESSDSNWSRSSCLTESWNDHHDPLPGLLLGVVTKKQLTKGPA